MDSSPARVLIVEDEPLIAMMIEDFCEEIGHEVTGAAETVAEALAATEAGGFDVAILDLHLRGDEQAWPVADALAARGIPFVLATGGQIEPPPERHLDRIALAKPFTMEGVRGAIEQALATATAP